MVFQLILLRLIRTPDKANKFLPSVGVRINEVLLYTKSNEDIITSFIRFLIIQGYS